MPLYLVTAPPVEPVTLVEVKSHCRIDHSDEDEYLLALIRTAREKIDARDGTLGRAIVLQTWDWKFHSFDLNCRSREGWANWCNWWMGDWRLELPLPPLQSVVSVKYLDAAGVEQTMDDSLYTVTGTNGWGPAYIEPVLGQCWPTGYGHPEAVRIRLQCGYAPDSLLTPTEYVRNIPDMIKLAIKMMVAAWYENRDTLGEMPVSADRLLDHYRVTWPFA